MHAPILRRPQLRSALRSLAGSAVALAVLGAAPAASAATTVRLDAADNVGAALAWSRQSFADGAAPTALLARDDLFADSLASGVAQAALEAPLLLTPTGRLDARVAAELDRLGARTVIVLGGPTAVSPEVAASLGELGYETERLAGDTRRETAIAIAERALPTATAALVARTGFRTQDPTQAFADSLAAGTFAAATGVPLLYTNEDRLSASTRAYLERSAVEAVTVVGGTDAVSDAVLAEIDTLLAAKAPDDAAAGARRVAGPTRAGTAVALARELDIPSAADAERVLLVEGSSPDAWASGFAAAVQSAGSATPLVLSEGADLPPETAAFLEPADGATALVCGPFVDPAACDEASRLMSNDPVVADLPTVLALPNGFQPEGVAIGPDAGTGADPQFYAGSIPDGAVYRGDLATGEGAVLVPGREGRAARGLEVDGRGRLFVAGGPTGQAYVYDAADGSELAVYQLSAGQGFVNDVVVTPTAAWFTDSVNPVLYGVPIGTDGALGAAADVVTLPLTGDVVYQQGFNLNGIDATPDGGTLIVVQSNTGSLFTVDPSGAAAGVTRRVDLGGEAVRNGDGILLAGDRTLYVVQNQDNVVARVDLADDLRSGRVTSRTTDPGFAVPTTIARFGGRLYAVNARFGTPPTPDTTYTVVAIPEP